MRSHCLGGHVNAAKVSPIRGLRERFSGGDAHAIAQHVRLRLEPSRALECDGIILLILVVG